MQCRRTFEYPPQERPKWEVCIRENESTRRVTEPALAMPLQQLSDGSVTQLSEGEVCAGIIPIPNTETQQGVPTLSYSGQPNFSLQQASLNLGTYCRLHGEAATKGAIMSFR